MNWVNRLLSQLIGFKAGAGFEASQVVNQAITYIFHIKFSGSLKSLIFIVSVSRRVFKTLNKNIHVKQTTPSIIIDNKTTYTMFEIVV